MHVPSNTLARVFLLLNIGWASAAAVPSEFLGSDNGPEAIHDPFADFPPILKARQNDKVDLRILPLGASIMEGQGSTYHSGYAFSKLLGFRLLTELAASGSLSGWLSGTMDTESIWWAHGSMAVT
jgi:hypothetical protein